jgi:hypothetical protein
MVVTFDTAEDILGLARRAVEARLSAALLLSAIPAGILPDLDPLGPQDEAREMYRALAALDVAMLTLSKPLEPVRDDLRE